MFFRRRRERVCCAKIDQTCLLTQYFLQRREVYVVGFEREKQNANAAEYFLEASQSCFLADMYDWRLWKEEGEGEMRLDKFLKISRIIKRRTVANEACDASHVKVNGRDAKASYDVKTGDVIAVSFGERTLTVRVLNVLEHAQKADASSMYEVISNVSGT